MKDDLLYDEKITSNKTEALFVSLALLFLLLFIWRVNARYLNLLSAVFFFFFIFFLFYSINYRTLKIRLTSESLTLKFGIFIWIVPLDNIESCGLDELPVLMRYGGAGIHFMTIRNRYRASYNFLDYPRVRITFKVKQGLVQEVSFSTRQPDEILRLIHEAVAGENAISLTSEAASG